MELTSKSCVAICLILSTIVFIKSRRISKTACSTYAVFYRSASNYILDEEPITRNLTQDIIGCMDLCVETAECIAFNAHVRKDYKIDCHTLRNDHVSKPSKLTPKKDWSLYDTGSRDTSRSVGSRCKSMVTNPCPSHCTCVDTCNSYQCDCYGPEIFKSCREALAAYPASDLNYWIKPEGTSSAAYGKCYKQVDSTFLFRIMHNSESRLLCNGYERPGSYHRPFFYPQNTVEDLSAVVDALGSCKQRTKMECVHMTLVNYASLIDRKGKDLSYFGGGPQDGKGCACGITGTCHSNRYLCNCDANTYSVLIDEGDVTNQTALPLTGIKLGDTGSSSEYGYHTVGPLECFDTFKSCADAKSIYPEGGPNYWIKTEGSKQAAYKNCK